MTRPLSTITLYKGVPFDQTYKHVIDFESKDTLDIYLANFNSVKLDLEASRQSINKPIRWRTRPDDSDTEMPTYNNLIDYNYLRLSVKDWSGHYRRFYAFITDFEYINDGLTLIYFSIDMWDTYKGNVHYNRAFIKRGMVHPMKEDLSDFTDEFKTIINNEEPIGGDGANHLLESKPIGFHALDESTYIDDTNIKIVLFTIQPKDATSDAGSLIGAYTQYRYMFFAYNPTSGICYDIYNNGNAVSKLNQMEVSALYAKLSKDSDLVGSSSLVVDSEVYNYIGLKMTIDPKKMIVNFTSKKLTLINQHDVLTYVAHAPMTEFVPENGKGAINVPTVNGDDTQYFLKSVWATFAERFGADFSPKLMFQPFSKIYITDARGTETTLDFGQFTNYSEPTITFKRYGGLTENGREQIAVLHYNRSATDDGSDYLVTYENAMMIDDAPRDVPIILDSYTEYINANRNQLRNTRANAKMNEKLSLQGNNLSLANAQNTTNTARNAQAYTQGRQQNMATLQGGISGAMSGLSAGGILGAVGGGIAGAAVGGLMTNYNNTTAMTASDMQRATAMSNAKANNAYSNAVATNNYQQAIRGQNAMLADVKNHNDEVAHEGSNFLFDIQNKSYQLHWQIFTSQDSVMKNADTYFKLFGYTINKYATIRKWLNRCKYFSYVEVSGANVSGEVNESVRAFFDDLFESGVTVWQSSAEAIEHFEKKDISDNLFVKYDN